MSSHILIRSDGLIVIKIFGPSDFQTIRLCTKGLSDYGTIRQ